MDMFIIADYLSISQYIKWLTIMVISGYNMIRKHINWLENHLFGKSIQASLTCSTHRGIIWFSWYMTFSGYSHYCSLSLPPNRMVYHHFPFNISIYTYIYINKYIYIYIYIFRLKWTAKGVPIANLWEETYADRPGTMTNNDKYVLQ